MAIDFSGTTSRLTNTTAAHGVTTNITICASVFADGVGGASVGRILTLDETANSLALGHATSANNLRFYAVFNTTAGVWTFPATDGQWNLVALSYSGSATANNPVARVNGAAVTVTRATGPAGTFVQPSAGYCIGNIFAQSQGWDGMIENVQAFSVILTDGEMDQACRRPGSVRRGLKLWPPMLHAGHLVDWSGNGFNGTGTALTNRVGGSRAAPLYTDGQFTLMGDAANQRLLYMGVG